MTIIPDHAKKVFDGVLFDIYQWDQKMYDGSIAVFERARKTYSSIIIAYYEGKIVITKQEQPSIPKPYYALIGGRVEKDETPLQNAIKELREEAGLECDEMTEIGMHQNGFKLDYQCHLFMAKNCRKVCEPRPDNGEKIELHYINKEEFIKMLKENKLQESRMLKLIFENELSPECENRIRNILN